MQNISREIIHENCTNRNRQQRTERRYIMDPGILEIIYAKADSDKEQQKVCIHCKRVTKFWTRRLCGSCYSRYKDLYPKVSDMRRNSLTLNLNVNCKPLPPEPTKAVPGSKEKVEVLRRRYLDGYSLWHPDDAKIDMR